MSQVLDLLCVIIGSLVLILLIIIPASLPIYLVYLMIKHLDKTKRKIISILFISFFLPFINVIYFGAGLLLNHEYFVIISAMEGILWLIILLPILFIIILLIPKEKFKYKNQTLITIILTMILGWSLAIISVKVDKQIKTKNIYLGFEQYNPTIKYLKNYKMAYNIYPKNLSKYKIYSKTFPYFNYKTYNNQKDFVLSISDNKSFFVSYRYCSNKSLENCSETNYTIPFVNAMQMGDWLKLEIND